MEQKGCVILDLIQDVELCNEPILRLHSHKRSNEVLYTGVTNNLERRMFEHRNKMVDGFTKRYNLTKLVYFEETSDIRSAKEREKQLKNWHRD